MRTHFCGRVDETLVGETVTLCGWADVARDLGGLCFIDLRQPVSPPPPPWGAPGAAGG